MCARGAELHQQLLAREVHRRELLEPRPQPFQLPPAHRPLLGHPIAALGEDIEFAVLWQQLHLHPGACFLPRLGQQRLLEPSQPPLGRAHEVMHRRIARAHLLEHRFGRDPSIHRPDPPRVAVLPLDAREEVVQGGLVRGIARQHLIGQRQTFRRHHQGNDHLHAVGPMIARVAEPALGIVGRGGSHSK